MPKKTSSPRRGRPSTIKGRPVMLYLNPEIIAQIDNWREGKSAVASRSEAVRALVAYALANLPPS